MDAKVEVAVAKLQHAIEERDWKRDVVSGLERHLVDAQVAAGLAQKVVEQAAQELNELLVPPKHRSMGEVYREQGVPGYENYTRS